MVEGGESRSYIECSKEPLYRGYRRLVTSVSEQLRKENALSLAYTYELPSWYYDSRDHDHSYALRVLIALEGKGIYCPENLVGLAEALESVQREDLGKSVREFIGSDIELSTPSGGFERANSYPMVKHPAALRPQKADESDYETDGMYRSREELESIQRQASQDAELGVGLRFALMNSKVLLEQLQQLQKSPTRPNVQRQITDAISTVQLLAQKLNFACTTIGSETSRHGSNISSPVQEEGAISLVYSTPSRKASRGSNPRYSGLSNQSSGIFANSAFSPDGYTEDPRNLSFQQDVEADGRPKPMAKKQAHSPLPPETIPPEDTTIAAPSSQEMHTQVYRTRSLKREEKKLCRRGLLVWPLKVKKLRSLYAEKQAQLESDDFFDDRKRRFKASLHPFGLGKDEGSHMTLCINCMDDIKTKDFPNTEIIVSVLDPESAVLTIQPIKLLLERRGIRFITRFISHEQVDRFRSNCIIITVAITGDNDQEPEQDAA